MNQHPGYELFEELGRGANTVVFRGYDLTLGRDVAIKELDESGRRDARHRERFLREAQFLAQFEHDNVLRVYSVDTERGWIIMELMKGTLASVIAAGPSEPDLVRSVLKQTLEALAFLHEKHKVHGTVRPTNLLINEAGRVKLSEFEQTDVGGELRAPTGSKKYLAPELIRPEFGDFGPPLDLYCLGFTALELLKGPQFDGLFPGTGKGAIDADIAWLRWHSSTEELASVRKLVKGIPDDLAHVLERMLKKHVADRPQSAQEVLQELADRPLVPVPVAGAVDEEEAAGRAGGTAPAVVRTIAAPESMSPRGAAAASPHDRQVASPQSAPAPPKTKVAAKSGKGSSPPAAPRFSRDWWNQQLGRPYVLYPLCAVILLGALWLSIRVNRPAAPQLIAVTFDVRPDATGVEVAGADGVLERSQDDPYRLAPGLHSLTFRKEGFEPHAAEFDVSAENNRFEVELTPVIRFHDVVIQVSPADAEVSIGGARQSLADGTVNHKLREGQPLEIEARRDGYEPLTRRFSPEELAELDHKLVVELEREKPRLPASLVAKPGAPLDPDTQLLVRVLATALADGEVMELALVKPGHYNFGAPDTVRRENELPQRLVRIDQPFYIAVHETTVAQYRRFYEAEGQSQAGTRWQRAARKWAEPLGLEPLDNRLPVTNVSVEEAQAFCRWMGGRLPTEIEWESAVRGADDRGYPFPWGPDEPTRDRCRVFHFYAAEFEAGRGVVPVEQLAAGASPLGLMHALGNAAEWCQDGEKPGSFVLRGCSITTANIDDVRVTWRRYGDSRGEEEVGFRVVVPIDATLPVPAPISASRTPTRGEPSGGFVLFAPLQILAHLPWQDIAQAVGHERSGYFAPK